MRGILLGIAFFGTLPFVLVKGPFIGILMWFWISLMNPHKLVWGSSFAYIPYALIAALATLLATAISRTEPKLPPAGKTTALLVLLMIWVSITSLLGTGPADLIYDKWQGTEKMLLMTLLAYALANTRARLDQLILVCVLSIAFFGVKGGLFSLLTGGANRVYGPTGSMIADNNDLGVALTMILPLLFYIRERYRQPYLRWPLLALVGLTFVGDVFTYSRGALVALIAMGGMLWLRSRQKIWMGMLIVVAAVGVWSFAPPEWFARMATIETYQQDQSAESRLYLWQLSWAMAMKHPVAGGGFRWAYDPVSVNQQLADSGLPSLVRPRVAHSNWFEMLGDHGFVGLAIFIAILASVAFDARWLIQRSRGNPDLLWANNLGRMLQVSLVGYCAGGSFATLATYDGFYAVVIIAAAARRVVAAELASRDTVLGKGSDVIARPPSMLTPQPTG